MKQEQSEAPIVDSQPTGEKGKSPVVFSVTSGKGGVGKTNISVNLAYCFQQMGYRSVLLDADLGLGNVDVLLGLVPRYNLFHLFYQGMDIERVMFKTPYGFTILPAASGVSEMLTLSSGQKLELLEALDPLEDEVDFFLVDTGAGINDNVLYFNMAVQRRVIVLSPEPTSLTDAYALIKVLSLKHGIHDFQILVNFAKDAREAKKVFSRLYSACDHFLNEVALDWLGFIPRDEAITKAVVAQRPFCEMSPQSRASENLRQVTERMLHWDRDEQLDGNIKFFWKKLLFQG